MKLQLKKYQLIQIVTILLILAVFIFFRWYKLKDSLLFYNDMGRDFVALLNWAESGKPPLLGPQTSVVSYNQSAWYFYFLFPFFVLTNHWPLSSTLTLTLVAIIIYLNLIWFTRSEKHYFWLISVSFLLLAVHPQAVLQNRFIWNPSFVPYFLLISLISLLQLQKQFLLKWSVAYWLSAAFTIGFSYSALPILLTTTIYLMIKNRKQILYHVGIAFISAILVLLPLLAFEVRHSFALSRLFVEGQTTPQTAASATIKSTQLLQLVFQSPTEQVVIALALGSLLVFSIGFAYAQKTQDTQLNQLKLFLILLVTNTLLFLFLPVNLEKHYIFPLIVLLFLTIASLPKKFGLVATVVLAAFWSQPYFIQWHTSPPARTIEDMQQCYSSFCQNFKQPAYVSMESGILTGYHNALEHQFFLREAGCTIYDISEHQNQATTMLVIGDNAEYTHGQSAYYELTLFGPATPSAQYTCTDRLTINQINKI